MTDFKNLFVYPDGYTTLDQRLQPEDLYSRFSKKILFRIKASPDNPYGITPPNGLLIYGPPGNGKSVLALQFAQMTGLPYAVVHRHDVLENEGWHTNGKLRELMTDAEALASCVIIMENIESIIPDRKGNAGAEYVDVMSNLSLMKNCGHKGVFVFATSSRPKDVDAQTGMCGYLNELFYTPFPDETQRMRIISMLMENKPRSDDMDYDCIVTESENFTIGDLASLVDEISLNAALAETVISNESVRQVLEAFRRPLTSLGKKGYDEIHAFLEAKNSQQLNQTIGFRRQ